MECWAASIGWFLVGAGFVLAGSSLLPERWRARLG